MTIDISVAVPGTARVGEGPFWDAESRHLTWVDILAGTIHRSDPAAAAEPPLTLPTLVGAAVPKVSGGFVAATADGFTDIDANGGWHARLSFLPPGIRMNDAKCDSSGRLWAGSCADDFAPGKGALHVLHPDWTTEQVLSGLTQPNGMGWSPDGRVYYLIDSQARELSTYDVIEGRVSPASRRILTIFPDQLGYPDGMTVDAQGGLWVAMWGGGLIVRLSPGGEIVGEVPVPVAQPTSCAFGGPGLDMLYVTTAREGLALDPGDLSGSVLAVTGLGVHGLPHHRFGG